MGNRRGGITAQLVEPYKQVKLGVIFLSLNLVFSFLIIGVFGYYVYDIYTSVSFYFKLSPGENLLTLKKFAVPFTVGGIFIILFVISTLWASIHYTHQIYGPLVSINRFVTGLLKNERPQPIQLRESDQLQELAIKLNELAERIFRKPLDPDSLKAISTYLEARISQKESPPLDLKRDDPLYEIASRIKQLE